MTLRGVLVTTVVVIAVLAGLALAVAASGAIDVAAATPHAGLTALYLDLVRERSIHREIESVEVPELTDLRAAAGARAYREMCAGCHGAPGARPGVVGRGLNPAPPDLSAADWSGREHRAEAFWVVRNGIRMTGMPAFGETHDDDALWDMVAFVARLPELDADSYRDLAGAPAGGADHGDHPHGGGGSEEPDAGGTGEHARDDGGEPHVHADHG